jgi:hypothetical protein
LYLQILGHRNIASVNEYNKLNTEQHQRISQILDTIGPNPPLAPAQTVTRENLTSPPLDPAQTLTRENIPSHSFPLSQDQSITATNWRVGPSTNNSSSSNISTLFGGNIYGGTFTINLYNWSENKKPTLDDPDM